LQPSRSPLLRSDTSSPVSLPAAPNRLNLRFAWRPVIAHLAGVPVEGP
jgi:hypothetical protein